MFYVYQLRVEDEPLPFYVGKGKNRRAREHLFPGGHQGHTYKEMKIRKVLAEGKKINVEYIETGLTEPDALLLETYYISAYGRKQLGHGPLTNLTDGGEDTSGHIVTEYRRKRASEVHKGKTLSEEYRTALSEANSKPKTEEQRRKIAESNRGARPKLTCPHRGLIRGNNVMTRYHFDKCRSKT